jgi:insertion element IS1 protein InsB
MKCFKTVVIKCRYCGSETIKYGKAGNKQRYCCKACKKTQIKDYSNLACTPDTNLDIAAHVKEGCGIRSISRLLHISATTVINRIQKIAEAIPKPIIITNHSYEVDELKTYVCKKTNDYWVICAMDRESRQIVDFKVGKRSCTKFATSYNYACRLHLR